MSQPPTLTEVALGVFLHDIGKLLQRAHAAGPGVDPAVKARESVILPVGKDGRYTHWHALWTEQFFESRYLPFPSGVNESRIRDVAAYHHRPDSPTAWIGAEADRLSAGMDRKPRDEESEAAGEGRPWGQYARIPLECPFHKVRIGRGDAPRSFMPMRELTPAADLFPSTTQDGARLPEQYAALWQGLRRSLAALDRLQDAELFCESLASLSERYLSTVPSSTKDQPDVSLHDHSRAAAAIAAAMYAWHAAKDNLADTAAIRDRGTPKFRLLVGDLSGIQSTLFRLSNQRVRGLNRILRARSFLFGMLIDAAALLARRKLGLPVFNVLENAGGRFLLLAADVPNIEEKVASLRREIERWMFQRYAGELSLNLALSKEFAAEQFMDGKFAAVRDEAAVAAEEAKQRAFSTCLRPVLEDAGYEHDVCHACAARPAQHVSNEDGRDIARCSACEDEAQLGGDLPRVTHLCWTCGGTSRGRGISLFGGLRLEWRFEEPHSPTGCISVLRVPRAGQPWTDGPYPVRWIGGYVPRLEEADLEDPRYAGLQTQGETFRAGDLKTFGHIAADAAERDGERWRGERFLAVLKADVDQLGTIFSWGVEGASLGLVAGISRLTDFFLSARLPEMLSRQPEFRSVYTVYAGGDDLLLIGPWRQTAELALRLREAFTRWTGGNPNITISAALELMKPNHPVNRAVSAAQRRLDRAKDKGGDRICAFDEQPLQWPEYDEQLRKSRLLLDLLRDGSVSQAFAHRILYFADERRRAETASPAAQGASLDLTAASWRARWGYQLARPLRQIKLESKRRQAAEVLNGLLGLNDRLEKAVSAPSSPRPAVTVALYRYRTATERR